MLISGANFFRIDLTFEKRYTLSPQTIQILEKINSPVEAELLLAGDLPPGFIKLRSAVIEKLHDLKIECDQPFKIYSTDPFGVADKKRYLDDLLAKGIAPVNLRMNTDRGVTNKTIFPTLFLRAGGNELTINLLKNDPFLRDEQNLIRSVELL